MAQPLARPDLSDLTLRVMSAAVLLPLVVAAIWWGEWYFGSLILLIGLAMGWEWSALCQTSVWLRGLTILTLVLSSVFALLGSYQEAFGCLAAGVLLGAVIARIDKLESAILLPIGTLYISIALFAILWIRFLPEAGLFTVLWIVSLVIATDVGAYFVGRFVGGPKLAPRISPSKTWSGLAGGVGCAVGAGVLVASLVGSGNLGLVALLSGVLAVVAQLGDLIESVVKRHFGVKDAGNLIPGHGGVLDRLDGFLTVAPVTGLMMWIAGGSPLKWQ